MSLFPNYDATDLFCFYHDLHDVGVVDSEPRTALFSMEKNKETLWPKMFFFPHFGQKKCDFFLKYCFYVFSQKKQKTNSH